MEERYAGKKTSLQGNWEHAKKKKKKKVAKCCGSAEEKPSIVESLWKMRDLELDLKNKLMAKEDKLAFRMA